MADRDDANLRHFQSRSQQNSSIPSKKQDDTRKIDIHVHFDSNFGAQSSEIDDLRFRTLGTSPAWSMYRNSCSRRSWQDCAGQSA